MQITQKVFVQHISLTAMEEAGWELSDDGEEERKFYGGEFQKEALLLNLTRRQREVAHCLSDMDSSRKETAKNLGVSLQAVHQIVLRMRKRLKGKADILWEK
jgi:DNA-directed RNA polymerase specialized sigma subunit